MKWILVVLIALDFGMGSLSNLAFGAQLRMDRSSQGNEFIEANQNDNRAEELSDAWAWLFFTLNTIITMSIVYKIFSSGSRAKGLGANQSIYNTVMRAIIESSLIVWVGLLTYAIMFTRCYVLAASPNPSYETVDDTSTSASVAFTVLPFVFGISQSMIIARIGFSRLRAPTSATKRTAIVFASDDRDIEEEDHIDVVLDITKGGGDIEISSMSSSTLA